MNYAKLLEMNSFLIWHLDLGVGKLAQLPNNKWETVGDALKSFWRGKVKRRDPSAAMLSVQV